MTLSGHSIIAGVDTPGTAGSVQPRAAATGGALEPPVSQLAVDQVGAATEAAAAASSDYRRTSPQQRAQFLRAIADAMEADGAAIIERAVAESGLPTARITGELGRTTGQLRLFAGVAEQGDHLGVRLDTADPARTPAPRPDLRQRMVPLGPVAVFGASNFPLAFSTAGGDTASAFAAGCPVVVKAHPAHPGAGELVARAIAAAAGKTGLPAGVFSLLHGGIEVGQALVADPRITAVGFTGSRAAGLALMATAAARPVPIPVYAEMSAINPVILLPGALKGDIDSLATGFVGSLTLGSGQFCTNPGLLLVPEGAEGDRFLEAAAGAVRAAEGQPMLTEGIAAAYARGTERLQHTPGVTTLAQGSAGAGPGAPAPQLSLADPSAWDAVQDEVFGASGVVVRYRDIAEVADRVAAMEGQLTATIHATESDADREAAAVLLPVLEQRVGRIIFNGWPTGVEVSHAIVHGGPFPATSDGRTTSVGSLAVERFQRPVCYQDVPESLLPDAVRPDNPWRLTRRIDGVLER